jgi:hypothetical protein
MIDQACQIDIQSFRNHMEPATLPAVVPALTANSIFTMKNSEVSFKCIVFLGSFLLLPPALLAQRPVPRLLEPVSTTTSSAARPALLPAGAEPPEYPTIPATNLPTKPVPEPLAKPTSGLKVQRQGSTITITGVAASHEDVWTYAEEVRQWKDVQRVTVGTIRIVSR